MAIKPLALFVKHDGVSARASITCQYKCGNACSHEVPNTSGSEYFRIWVVNLLLTVVTLGLYLPFARARQLRYFHENTLIDGAPLAFHGDPWKMLRGYLIIGAALLGKKKRI